MSIFSLVFLFTSYPLLRLPLPGTGPVEFTTGVRDYNVPSHEPQGDLGERPDWVRCTANGSRILLDCSTPNDYSVQMANLSKDSCLEKSNFSVKKSCMVIFFVILSLSFYFSFNCHPLSFRPSCAVYGCSTRVLLWRTSSRCW